MPNRHTTLTSLFTDIANAIRNKTGSSADIKADDFDTAIAAIPSGGGGSDDYFYVECVEEGAFRFSSVGTVDVALQYSTDKTNWTDYTINTQVNMTTGQKIYWKNNKNYLNYGSNNYLKLYSLGNFKFNIGGRINSLINNIDGGGCYPYAFINLFASSSLINASELVLNKYVSAYCYSNMFSSCSSLTAAPELPATILANNCYQQMFYGCAALTKAPELPATRLGEYCYSGMFQNCTSLTTVPNLPATILANNCYQYMFQNCRSLTTAPALQATTLASYCYSGMFQNCTSLIAAPELPATTLASRCYDYMFTSCTSLTTAPQLPATTLQIGSYQNMFSGCTSLKVYSTSGEGHDKAWNIPSTGPITGTTRSMSSMFINVETDNVPANWPGTTGQQFTYYTQNDPV